MKKASVLAIVIILIVSFQTAFSEYWVKTSIPSVEIKALALCEYGHYSNNNALIALTNDNKIYRLSYSYDYISNNSEELKPSNDSIEYTSIASLDSTIYLGTNKKGIFYSSDMGNSWNNITENIGDECGDNADASPIPISDNFPSGDDAPPAHPRCRCYLDAYIE